MAKISSWQRAGSYFGNCNWCEGYRRKQAEDGRFPKCGYCDGTGKIAYGATNKPPNSATRYDQCFRWKNWQLTPDELRLKFRAKRRMSTHPQSVARMLGDEQYTEYLRRVQEVTLQALQVPSRFLNPSGRSLSDEVEVPEEFLSENFLQTAQMLVTGNAVYEVQKPKAPEPLDMTPPWERGNDRRSESCKEAFYEIEKRAIPIKK